MHVQFSKNIFKASQGFTIHRAPGNPQAYESLQWIRDLQAYESSRLDRAWKRTDCKARLERRERKARHFDKLNPRASQSTGLQATLRLMNPFKGSGICKLMNLPGSTEHGREQIVKPGWSEEKGRTGL